MQKCWVCNINEANSGEHKIKASEIRKLMGNKKFDGFYKGTDKFITIENSKHHCLKFPKIICESCNNTKTSKTDEAYSDFMSQIVSRYENIECEGKINFKEIFGEAWLDKKMDLYRYIAKHAGCKTFSDKGEQNIDLTELSNFIWGKESIKNFQVFFRLNPAIKFYSHAMEYIRVKNIIPFLANGATIQFEYEDNTIFGGSIIHSFLRIEWLITDNFFNITQIDFNKENEDVEIIDWDFYPTPFSDIKDNIESIEYLIFGKFKDSISEVRNYFKGKFKEISS